MDKEKKFTIEQIREFGNIMFKRGYEFACLSHPELSKGCHTITKSEKNANNDKRYTN